MDVMEPSRIEMYPIFWRRPRWIYGRPAELWVRYRDVVADFVKKANLQPIPPEHLVFDEPVPVGGTRAEALPIKPRPFPGGMRMPHLHFTDRIYQLDQEQWKAFSGQIVKGLQDKLGHAGTVSVTQLVEVSDAVGDFG